MDEEPHVEIKEVLSREQKERIATEFMQKINGMTPISPDELHRFIGALESIADEGTHKIYSITAKSQFSGLEVCTEALSLEEAKQDAVDLKSIVDQRGGK